MSIYLPLRTKPDFAVEQWTPPEQRPRPQMTRSQDAWCRRNIKGYADLQDAMKKRPTTGER